MPFATNNRGEGLKALQTVKDFRQTWRTEGAKGTFRRYGWKMIAAVFCYYLVRDVLIYLLIPFWLARQIVN